MNIDQIIAEATAPQRILRQKAYLQYMDFLTRNSLFHTSYPDGSRTFDDILSVICMISTDNSPFHSVFAAFPLQHIHTPERGTQIYFEDGFRPPPFKHNFVELDYVADGRYHKQIEGHEYVFEKGDIILIDKDISHTETYYQKKQAVVCLRIANAFFDKSMHLDVADREVRDFLERFVIRGNRKYHFIRFIPKIGQSMVPGILDRILDELWKPHPGSTHIIIGYVEWLLNLLPQEYELLVQWNNRSATKRLLFEEVCQYLNGHYRNASIRDLIKQFGHNENYFNQLIKRHTGLTYSAFLQDIRLRQAELLLKTTGLTVEEIAWEVGYESQTYFYRLFYEKFKMKPNQLRNSSLS